MEWIHVKDRLPTMKLIFGGDDNDYWVDSVDVLAWDDKTKTARVAIAVFDKKLVWIEEGGREFTADYWMPLPDGPKDVS